jgi:hypothetical protein
LELDLELSKRKTAKAGRNRRPPPGPFASDARRQFRDRLA